MANEVVSTYERVDQVIATFARQVGDYINDMNSEVSSLQTAISTLGSGWQGESYDNFSKSVMQKIQLIIGQIKNIESLKDYLDDVSREFRAYLDQLREAGEL